MEQKSKQHFNPNVITLLWREVWLPSENQIMVFFSHIIADGVCAVEVMHHLFQVMADPNSKLTISNSFDVPPNLLCITNIGKVQFSGGY